MSISKFSSEYDGTLRQIIKNLKYDREFFYLKIEKLYIGTNILEWNARYKDL